MDAKPNENFIDCTLDGGGHTALILERIAPRGKVLGIDRDSQILKRLESNFKDRRLIPVCGNFADLKAIVQKKRFGSVKGILFDLGVSSWHLEKSGRGFTFKRNEPLDMRYDVRQPLTAEKILNYWSRFQIEKILSGYGEEKRARPLARMIIEARKAKPVKSTFQLRGIARRAQADCQKVFQALRIAVNDELNNLEKALPQAVEILTKGGRLVVISFHSLEDRLVKNYFNCLYSQKAGEGPPLIKILTKKPVRPSETEIRKNPRSRSAKLRAICKLGKN